MELELDSIYGTPVFVLRTTEPAFKAVYGASYWGQASAWRFPAFFPVHKSVLADLRKLAPKLTHSPSVVQHLQRLDAAYVMPADFSYLTKPYQHQIDGLEHILRNLRAGLFYAPGLGKCKIITDWLRVLDEPALILCPRVMLNTWQEELYTHGRIPSEVVTILDAASKAKKVALIDRAIADTPRATVVTYATAALHQEQILKIRYKLIVADESHQMASPFSNRTKAAAALASRAYRRVLLSGTPSLGSPFDLYAQLRFLGVYFCPEDWWAFRKKFGVYPEWEANENVPKMLLGFKNLDIINERVNRVCVRRTKEECLDLPERVIIDKKFALGHSLKKVYNDFIMDRADAAGFVLQKDMDAGQINNSTGPVVTPHVLAPETITVLGKLSQISSGFMYKTTKNPKLCDGCVHLNHCLTESIQPYTPKCQVVREDPAPHVEHYKDNARIEQLEGLLEELLLDDNNKVIIWANFITQLDDVCALATKLKYDFVRVQGGMSTEELRVARTTFNENPKVRLYVGQASTGIGITLNSANYTVYYDLPWSLEHYLQSIDRNYRIGQSSKVTVYRLLGAHTLDEAKAAALDQKMDFSHLVTTRSICATCPEFARRCAAHKISLYDPDCIHDRVTMRKTAEIKLIP